MRGCSVKGVQRGSTLRPSKFVFTTKFQCRPSIGFLVVGEMNRQGPLFRCCNTSRTYTVLRWSRSLELETGRAFSGKTRDEILFAEDKFPLFICLP